MSKPLPKQKKEMSEGSRLPEAWKTWPQEKGTRTPEGQRQGQQCPSASGPRVHLLVTFCGFEECLWVLVNFVVE